MKITIPEKSKFVLECNDWELEMIYKAVSNFNEFNEFNDIESATIKRLIEEINPVLKVGSRYNKK